LNGKYENLGILYSHIDNSVYTGNFHNDKFEGFGKLEDFRDSFYYEGEFKNGRFNGKGKLVKTSNYEEIYYGEWEDGFTKKGTIFHVKSIFGEFKGVLNDVPIELLTLKETRFRHRIGGEGVWYDQKGYSIIGKVPGGKIVYANGDVYEGQGEYDFKQGNGKMIYTNGNVYLGDWFLDKKGGKGTMAFKNGDIYEGDWRRDVRSGKGKLIYVNGDIYEGEWYKDKKHGAGKFTYKKENKIIEGIWVNDLLDGDGTIIFINGSGSISRKAYWIDGVEMEKPILPDLPK
jgi:hypothetical protein